MRYFFSNHELRNLHKEEELEDYFQFRKKYDEIKDLPSSDLAVIGTPYGDVRLLYETIRDGRDITEQVMDRAADEEHSGLILQYGIAKPEYVPVMHTAVNGLCDACGVSGRTLFLQEANSYRVPLTPKDRSEIFTKLLRTNQKPIHLLFRDEEVACIASSKYGDLDAEAGYNEAKDYLEGNYQNVEFDHAQISQEYLAVYFTSGEDTAQISDMLQPHIGDCKVKLEFRFSTSDTTDSKMRVTPIYTITATAGGKTARIPVGAKNSKMDIGVDHRIPNTIEDLTQKMEDYLLIVLRENENAIERLGNMPIKHVAGCLQEITRKFSGLSKVQVNGMAKKLVNSGKGEDGYAIDVFLAILDTIEEQCKDPFDLAAYITLTERAAEYVFRDYTRFDRRYEDPDEQ